MSRAMGRFFQLAVSLLSLSIKSAQQSQDCKVSGVHVALTGVQNEMRITWTTLSKTCPSLVSYGLPGTDQKHLKIGNGTIDHYRPYDMCDKPATHNDFQKFYIHTVVLKNLQESSRYFYTFPADSSFVESSFYTPHPVSPKTSTHFIAVGDTGEHVVFPDDNPGSAMNFGRMRRTDFEKYRLVLHVGDLSYADGTPAAWPSFMDLIQPVAKHVPYMITVGNHEFDYGKKNTGKKSPNDPSGVSHYQPSWGDFVKESGGECGVPTVKHFPMQKYGNLDNPPFWYSFDYGSAHIITLSTEHSLSPKHEQYHFLQDDLNNIDRCGKTPWVIVLMHRPMYAVPKGTNQIIGEHLRKHIEEILVNNKVDLIINGHEHVYYHTCPVANKKCESSDLGVVNLIIGNGGRKLQENFEENMSPNPEWFQNGKLEYGHALFDIQGSSDTMKVTILAAQYGQTINSFKVHGKSKQICAIQEQ